MSRAPQRIVCLSAEAADWLWRIGAWEQVVGVTAFFDAPSEAPARTKVSGFSTAHLDAIEELNPDLVITFSDVQAKLAEALIQKGIQVLATNQRTIAEVEQTLALLARVVHRAELETKLLEEFREALRPVQSRIRPRVYFEEWNDPLVSGIAWVSELIERAGGVDVFSNLRTKRAAAERVVRPEQVIEANPEIVLASWCGKPAKVDQIAARTGWHQISAVKENRIFEIPSDDILQPGFRLIDGYQRIKTIISDSPAAK